MSLKVLFIGGTGIISSGCAPLAVQRGIDLTLLNRGMSDRPAPDGARLIRCDVRDATAVREALAGLKFDVVVNWVAFVPEHVLPDIELFGGRVGQYVFISSASAYQTPPASLPVTESTPLDNPYWEYSRNKIACEEALLAAYRASGFPVTIVRPTHTYDERCLPFRGGYTAIARIRQGKPVVVHGDGTSLWTMTHHRDFAKGFVGLLGLAQAVGQAIHVTTDEYLSWNSIHEIFARAAGATAHLVHVPSTTIARFDAGWGEGLLGDMTHSMIFDNTKIKRLVPGFAATIPLSEGAREVMAWIDANPARQTVDPAVDALMDRLIAAQESLHP
ncbi:MAG: SDR family oxidoreductase [Capsulimonadaceae bacterium]